MDQALEKYKQEGVIKEGVARSVTSLHNYIAKIISCFVLEECYPIYRLLDQDLSFKLESNATFQQYF